MTNPPKVFIATPSHDHKFHASFAFSLFRLQAARLFPLHITKVGGAGVARARNNQAHEFLTATDCEIFACVDSDIDFEVEHFVRCVRHISEGGHLNVNGLYCLKQTELAWCINAISGEAADPATGLQRVATAGTGFKFIHRSVFERMIAEYPEIAYVEDLSGERGKIRHDFFSMGVVGATPGAPGRYLTEDWYFDHRCGRLGIPVHVDATFHVKHEGLISYPLVNVFASDQHSVAPLWPADFLAQGVASDHCADVLAGCYDVTPEQLATLSPALPAAPVILDLGANVGAFARWAAQRWPGCELHCYEPAPANFALLLRTLGQVPGAHAYSVAVLDTAGTRPLYRGLHNCGEHSLFDVGEQGAELATVRTISAASLPRADILKLDTEGAELVILSALDVAGRLGEFSVILLEYHTGADADQICGLLTAAGFTCIAHRPRHPGRGEMKFLRQISAL